MKKLILFVIPLLIVLAFFQNSYARSSYKSYEVAQIQSGGILVRDFKGDLYLIKKDSGDIKVGDLIRYDSGRHRLKKSAWQLIEITEMTNRTITFKLNRGEKRKINMQSKYRGKFKQGDRVYYKKSTGQIKESKFQ